MKLRLEENESSIKVGYPFTYLDMQEYYNSTYKNSHNDNLIKETYQSFKSFLDDVNDKICNKFDASYGTNWDDINDAINETLEELKTNEN